MHTSSLETRPNLSQLLASINVFKIFNSKEYQREILVIQLQSCRCIEAISDTITIGVRVVKRYPTATKACGVRRGRMWEI